MSIATVMSPEFIIAVLYCSALLFCALFVIWPLIVTLRDRDAAKRLAEGQRYAKLHADHAAKVRGLSASQYEEYVESLDDETAYALALRKRPTR